MRNKITKLLLSVLVLISVYSCMPKEPYEIRSPCVAVPARPQHQDPGVNLEGGALSTYIITPCIRRPANVNYDIV